MAEHTVTVSQSKIILAAKIMMTSQKPTTGEELRVTSWNEGSYDVAPSPFYVVAVWQRLCVIICFGVNVATCVNKYLS